MSEGHESDEDLVQVLATTDPGLLALIRSLLESAGIPHVVQGEAALQLFPLGAAGSQVTSRRVGASILVPPEHAAEARALIETPPEPIEEGD